MAKIKYNVKGVERGGKDFVQPQPGLYEMEIKEANPRNTDGKNDIEVVLEVTKNNDDATFHGGRVWTYVNLGESSQWKLAELTDALGLPESGELDTDKLVGKKLKVKINPDSWNGEYRARAGRFAPLSAEADEAGAIDDEALQGGGPHAASDEPIVIERNNVELSTDPEYYSDWSDEEVFEELTNQELSLGRKKKSRENVIAALIAIVEADSETAAATGGTSDTGDEYDDTDTWSDKDLADEYKKRGLDTIEGKKNRAKVIEALRADDAGTGAGNEDDPFAD